MKAIVAYESSFGNTRAVADAVARGLRPFGETRVIGIDELGRTLDDDVELVVVGAPTHRHGVPAPTGEVLAALPRRRLVRAAAFDTRYRKPRWLTGSAAARIARLLRRAGMKVAGPPESFFVTGREGPLEDGELERAERWAGALGHGSADMAVGGTQSRGSTTGGFGVTLLVTLVIWFALMIGAIVTVSTLSAQGAISLGGGIAVFAVMLSAALIIDGYLWLRWFRQRSTV